jgi:hypothetical protein
MNGEIDGGVAATFLTGIVILIVSWPDQPACGNLVAGQRREIVITISAGQFKMASNLA